MEANWAINSFIRDALSGSPIRVNGDGRTVRSYLYASDLAFWLLRILTGSESGAVFNVGSDEGINLEFLARIVSENFNPKPEIRLKTAAGVIPNSRMVPDVSAATRVLGLTRSVSLSAAIERTIEWNKSL